MPRFSMGLTQFLQHLLDGQFVHAAEMPERAVALEAGAAFDASQSTRAAGDSGRVCSGLEEPNSATSGRPSAAATCIRPESLVTTAARRR